jgi:hypothetical protein
MYGTRVRVTHNNEGDNLSARMCMCAGYTVERGVVLTLTPIHLG